MRRSFRYRESLLKKPLVATVSITTFASMCSSWTTVPSIISSITTPQLITLEPLQPDASVPSRQKQRNYNFQMRLFSSSESSENDNKPVDGDGHWHDVIFPYEDWTHNSAKVTIPAIGSETEEGDVFQTDEFQDRLDSTIIALKEMGKSSIWVDVHISRARLIEEMAELGLTFHHAQDEKAVLNMWLKSSESLVPEFATHHIGVGGLCINRRNEILCVRELHRNYVPWKIPGGLSELGEHLDEAVVREVFEETGVRTEFRDVLCFRHTHGMANNRSDMYFVCRLDLVEDDEVDTDGNSIIPEPQAQPGEIETAAWIPYEEFRSIIFGEEGSPVIRHVLEAHERGTTLQKKLVHSSIPGRKPSPIYSPIVVSEENDTEESK